MNTPLCAMLLYVDNVRVVQTVKVAQLRRNLSAYLKRVQSGEEILVSEHNRVIARLAPPAADTQFSDDVLELARQGLVRLPEKTLDVEAFLAMPAPQVSLETLRKIIDAERDED